MSEAEETAEVVAEDVVATEEPVAEAVAEDAPAQDEPAAEVEVEPEAEAPAEAVAEDEVSDAVAAAAEEPVAEGLVAIEAPAAGGDRPGSCCASAATVPRPSGASRPCATRAPRAAARSAAVSCTRSGNSPTRSRRRSTR